MHNYALLTNRELKDCWILVKFFFCVVEDGNQMKVQKREKRNTMKRNRLRASSPGRGELARRLEKETRGQPQRFLNKNKNTLNYYLSLFTKRE